MWHNERIKKVRYVNFEFENRISFKSIEEIINKKTSFKVYKLQ
jgi:hypothetical protein